MRPPKTITLVLLFALAVSIKVFSLFPFAVERYYSKGLYPYVASLLRILFGWIPFSIGDLLYLFFGIYWLRKLILLIIRLFKKEFSGNFWAGVFKQVIFGLMVIYIVFNIFWGLNYNRPPMEKEMGISLGSYSTENLRDVLDELKIKLDAIDSTSRLYRTDLHRKKTLFQEAVETYHSVSQELPELKYNFPSVKPSLYSYLGNYLGFTGYYNPFSGEAQANTTVPTFVQPFTTCHEIGHQLGYAKENEANFAGFLAARSSLNPAFKYSVYFDMYSYTIREMYRRDSITAKELIKQLRPNVREDFKTISQFYKRYENPFEPIIRKLYGKYLKANEQPAGLKSYNEVVAMLIGYKKKYGHI